MRKAINKKTEFIKDQCKKFVIMIFVTITLQQCFDGIAKALQSSIQPDKNAFCINRQATNAQLLWTPFSGTGGNENLFLIRSNS